MKLVYWILCRLGRHAPYTHKDANDFLCGKPTICPRCKRRRFVP